MTIISQMFFSVIHIYNIYKAVTSKSKFYKYKFRLSSRNRTAIRSGSKNKDFEQSNYIKCLYISMIILVIKDNIASELTSKKQDRLPLLCPIRPMHCSLSPVSICNLFNSSVSNSVCTALNDWMIINNKLKRT
jgi:hypothetical protein